MSSKTFVFQKELSNSMQDECKYVIQEVVVFRIHKLLKEWDNLQGLVDFLVPQKGTNNYPLFLSTTCLLFGY